MRSLVRPIFCSSASASSESAAERLLAEQVVVQRQVGEVAAGPSAIASASIGSRGKVSVAWLAAQPLERRDDSCSGGSRRAPRGCRTSTSTAFCDGICAIVPGMWRRTQMSSSASRMKIGQRVERRLAVAHEHRAGPALEDAVAQQRDERRHEDEVRRAGRAARSPSPRRRLRAPGRRAAGSSRRRKRGFGDVPDGDRHVAAAPSGWRRPNQPTAPAARFRRRRRPPAGCCRRARSPPWSGSAGPRRPSSGRASETASSLLIAASALIAAARTRASGSDSVRRICGTHWAADVAVDCAQRIERARAHRWGLVIEQQRRHQVALVERLEHVDGVDHARRLGWASSWTSVSTVERSPPLSRISAGARSRRSMLCRKASR